jgi:histidyl-tRNA synthetase
MELLPAPQTQLEAMMDVLRKTYALYGFTPLDTPAVEAADVLLAKGGGETEKQIYRFQKGDADLALRFDLTVPLAKYVAMHYGELAFPFRRYQIGKVYRGERAQRGRFREFYQADIDVIGDGKLDIVNEAEIPSIIYRTFTALGLRRFQIRVNNRKILNGFYAMQGISDKSGDIMRTVDKLDKIGPDKVREIPHGRLRAHPAGRRRPCSTSSPSAARTRRCSPPRSVTPGKTRLRPGAFRAARRHQISGRLRRAGGELRRRSHDRARTRLLHRHRL